MKHPFNWLAKPGRSVQEQRAILGDITEVYRTEIRPRRSWPLAQAWYLKELAAAFFASAKDRSRSALDSPHSRAPNGFFELNPVPDLRHALRRWRRRPAFAASAVLTLALGIAAATATFAIVDAVLLRPLPWARPESIVVVHGVYPERRSNPATAETWDRWYLSTAAWEAIEGSDVFTETAAWRPNPRLDWTLGEGDADLVRMMDVSPRFLPLLGVRTVLGRHFSEADEQAPGSIILTHETWLSRFGGRSDIIGATVRTRNVSTFDEIPRTVVGVIEPGFRYGTERPDVLVPVLRRQSREFPERAARIPPPTIRIIARLAPGVSKEAAESVAAALVTAAPSSESGTARLVFIEDEQLGSARRPLWLVFAGAAVLLLVACANVAGLLLAESHHRRSEIAIRIAIGGSRRRIVRQLLVEHAVLATLGAGLGLAASSWLIGAAVALAPTGLPRLDAVALDLRVAAFAVVAGLATLLVFGVAPALSLSRAPVTRVLGGGGRGGATSPAGPARLIVSAQVALALVLMTGAILFGETIARLRAEPLGFQPSNLAVVVTTFAGARYGDPEMMRRARDADPSGDFGSLMTQLATVVNNGLTDQVTARVAQLPGVIGVGGSSAVPFLTAPVRIDVVPDGAIADQRQDVLYQRITASYFETMGIRVLSGRRFAASDAVGPRIAIVSREFERRLYPNGAVGQSFDQVYGNAYELSNTYEIVGVVEDVRRQDFADDHRPAMYAFDRQFGGISHFIVRTSGDASEILPAVRQAITDVSPQLLITTATTVSERVGVSIAEERFRANLSTAFGTAALILATVGLYGLVARRAADRRHEFGVRVALGAQPGDVGRLVVREAVAVIGLGLLVGLPVSYAAAQLTHSLLFGVTTTSAHVFAGAAGALTVAALTASMLPARRASRADPLGALKD